MLESGDWYSYEQEKNYNCQEAENLTFRLEQGVIEVKLHQTEVIVMMENMVFEGCFYNVNSSSPELHIITMRLYEEDMKGDLIFHVIHVAGTWIKELVIDGLSIE